MSGNAKRQDYFLPAAIVILLAVGVFGASFLYLAERSDDAARQHDEAVVTNGVGVRITEIAERAADYITAQSVMSGARLLDASALHERLGRPLYEAHDFDVTFLLDGAGRAVYAASDGAIAQPSLYAPFERPAAPLIDALREIYGGGFAAGGATLHMSAIADVDGAVYVLTAAMPASRARTGAARAPVVVTAHRLDDRFLGLIADRFLLDNLRLVSAGEGTPYEAQAPLVDMFGDTVARLSWAPQKPGATLLLSVAPPAAALIAALGLLALSLYRRARQSARNLIASEARATHLAYHDALTGLPNRLLLADRLGRAVEDMRRRETPFAVHCLDLDRFKEVNDTFGHQAGDELIRLAAQRINSVCRANDTVARLGGDEFAIIQSNTTLDGAAQMAERIVRLMAEPFDLSVGRVHIGASCGIAFLTDAAPDQQECLRQADLALYRAKEQGRGCYCVFEAEMDAAVRFRRSLQADLHVALETDTLELVYQPQVDGHGHIVGLEALLRWTHPERGALSPALFVPVAEESGLIDAIGMFTIRKAFEDSRLWPELKVAVNISATQLRAKGFISRLRDLVEAHKVEPRRFELEITEGVLLGDDPHTHAALSQIRAMGFSLALDDFGTGYSSLSYLQRYPIDKIKIDRSFIINLGVDLEADAVVTAIVRLARALQLAVIAEGVETDEQRRRLAQAGCGEVQGYLFGKPSPPEAIQRMLAAQRKHEEDSVDTGRALSAT